MSEIVLSSSSNSVDKAIDEYHNPSSLVVLVIVVLVIATAVVEEIPRMSIRMVSLGFP